MLLIKTKVKKSKIPNSGKGLFTKEDLKEGQPIWRHNYRTDLIIYQEDYDKLKRLHLTDYIDVYGTVEKNETRYYDIDSCRFMNHSTTPNIIFIGNIGLAIKDIPKGKELYCDYRSITTKEHYKKLL